MTISHLTEKAEAYLYQLCVEIPSRRVGSPGNRAATDLFAAIAASFGFEVETPEFDCIDWQGEGADLTAGGRHFTAFPSPYSRGCRVRAPLVVASTDEQLAAADINGKVLLLRGEAAKEQLMPKNFAFYNPDRHRWIIRLLEERQPWAIITATARDLEMVGSQYPFPLFEDGDFNIPSVYMTDEEGDGLAELAGEEVALESRATRTPATGCNVIARKGAEPHRRVVLFAHIDARMGSPGAGDNASGVTALLLLAELLADYCGSIGVEIVALNGEDYYANPGEMQYLALNEGKFGEIVLGINLDDVGYRRGRVAYSLYGCPDDLTGSIRGVLAGYEEMVEGEAWYQGDHGLFLMNQTPALAFTSEMLAELMAEITHTPKDIPETVNPPKLVQVALALRDLVLWLDGRR